MPVALTRAEIAGVTAHAASRAPLQSFPARPAGSFRKCTLNARKTAQMMKPGAQALLAPPTSRPRPSPPRPSPPHDFDLSEATEPRGIFPPGFQEGLCVAVRGAWAGLECVLETWLQRCLPEAVPEAAGAASLFSF